MILFRVYKLLSLYNGCLETVHINNQIIIYFFNLWSKEAIENISHISTVTQIGGYPDAGIGATSVRYIISIDKEINTKKNKIKRSQGGDILRLLRKNYLEGKWLTIYVNEEQHLPYWQLVNKK